MSYEVKFRTRDMPGVVVDTKRGEKLKELWFDEDKRNTPIEISGSAYLIGDIKAITRIADPKPITIDWSQEALPSGKICNGEYSIQKEINNIAKDEGDWGTLIRDKKWREKTRQKLLSMSDKWCDFKTNSCACDGLSQSQ